MVFGLTAAVIGDFTTHIAWYIFPSLQQGSDWLILFIHQPFFIVSQLLVPLSIGFSILRLGLWEIDLFNITYGAVFLCCNVDEHPQFVSMKNVKPEMVGSFAWDDRLMNKIHQGLVMKQPENSVFPLLVPLTMQLTKQKQPELMGVLALGPLEHGRQYSLDELWTFKRLASQTGTAIYIAQLNTANYQHLQQKIIVLEQRLNLLESQPP